MSEEEQEYTVICASCNRDVEDDWKNCPYCSNDLEDEENGILYFYPNSKLEYKTKKITISEARKLFTTLEFAAWIVSGKPDVNYVEDEDETIIGFAFGLEGKEQQNEFLRFFYWKLGPEKYKNFSYHGFGLSQLDTEDPIEPEEGHEIVSPDEIEEEMDEEMLEIWEQAGRPAMCRDQDGNWFFADDIGAYRWEMITDYIPNEKLDGH
jgi:hypothetical protein